MALPYAGLVIWHLFRQCRQVVGLDHILRIVYVELEVRHNGQVVPYLVGVFREFQLWEELFHRAYDGFGAKIAFLPVLDGQTMVDHLLEVPAIFGHREPFQPCVICQHMQLFVFCGEEMSEWLTVGKLLSQRGIFLGITEHLRDVLFVIDDLDIGDILFIRCRIAIGVHGHVHRIHESLVGCDVK